MIYTFKVTAANVIMLAIVLPLRVCLDLYMPGATAVLRGIRLFLPAMAGGIVFFAVFYIMKVDEAMKAVGKIRGILEKHTGGGKY